MLISMKFEVLDARGVRSVAEAEGYVRPLLVDGVKIMIHELILPYAHIQPFGVPQPNGGTNFSGTAWISTAP
jgi:hypothetical protein